MPGLFVDEGDRSSNLGVVSAALGLVVLLETTLHIVGAPYIQSVVGTPQDVNKIRLHTYKNYSFKINNYK